MRPMDDLVSCRPRPWNRRRELRLAAASGATAGSHPVDEQGITRDLDLWEFPRLWAIRQPGASQRIQALRRLWPAFFLAPRGPDARHDRAGPRVRFTVLGSLERPAPLGSKPRNRRAPSIASARRTAPDRAARPHRCREVHSLQCDARSPCEHGGRDPPVHDSTHWSRGSSRGRVLPLR